MEGHDLPASQRSIELALAAAQAAADKKADDIVLLDVADQIVITDIFVVASAPNERQVISIVDAIEEALLNLPEKAKPVRREGERAGRWVLLDYVDIVVHVQHAEEREFYALDRLWKDCERIPFVDRDLAESAAGDIRVTRLFIWRHGQTEWNAISRVQGQTDVALDSTRPRPGGCRGGEPRGRASRCDRLERPAASSRHRGRAGGRDRAADPPRSAPARAPFRQLAGHDR